MSGVREVLDRTRRGVETRKRAGLAHIPEDDRRAQWSRNGFRIIAEIKRSSLSAGAIRPDLDLPALARSYEGAGAAAISILTEKHSFGGSLDDLACARKAVSLPLLQKDFVIDAFQIAEAKHYGASFVLLIARFLTRDELQSLLSVSRDLRMNAIVEITDETDLKKITEPVEFLGVNSRNLETLIIETGKFAELRKLLPDSFLIAESGIQSREMLRRVMDLGYHGALIGEHFLKCVEPAAELASFVRESGARPRVKVCGITTERDAMLAVEAGANALGFIFADSPRRISQKTLSAFRRKIPAGVQCVGVFLGQSEDAIAAATRQFDLDVAQIYDDLRPPMPVWNAYRFHSAAQAASASIEPLLWDVKASESDLPLIWKSLATRPVFALAGGLHSGNVAQAVEICNPVWVDVARGVEKAPGVKDPEKLNAFMKVLR